MRRTKNNLIYGGGSKYAFAPGVSGRLVDVIDMALYREVSVKKDTHRNDAVFDSVENLWSFIIGEKAHLNQNIVLNDAILTEWLPMSPGLYHTPEAWQSRLDATLYVVDSGGTITPERLFSNGTSLLTSAPINEKGKNPSEKFIEFSPYGKEKLVLGGIGNVRLTPKSLFTNQQIFILGASSNGVCHEGIPVLLTEDLYENIINTIKENCGVLCNLVGKLCILPTEKLRISYPRKIPKYCLWVQDIKLINPVDPKDITITVAVNFASARDRHLPEKKWSFVTFHPDQKEKNLNAAVDWLVDYKNRYSFDGDGIILSDFDEVKDHFENVDFPIKDLANGQIDFGKLQEFKTIFNSKIIFNVMGDNIQGNIGSTIVTHSNVENSFNTVQGRLDSGEIDFLKHISETVLKSENEDAKDHLKEFNKELEKPEPKKSLLKTFWNGLTTALPLLISNTDKVFEIIEKVSRATGHS